MALTFPDSDSLHNVYVLMFPFILVLFFPLFIFLSHYPSHGPVNGSPEHGLT